MNNRELSEIYLDWFNNYLTIERFAEDYGLFESSAKLLIDAGRDAHERSVREIKELKQELSK